MIKELELISYNGNSNDIRVSHRTLAEYMGLRQDNVRVTIESHMELFQSLGTVPLIKETIHNGGNGAEREVETFYLDSDQTNLLIGFVRSTEITDILKLNVVKSFKKAKDIVNSNTSKLTDEQQTRNDYEFRIRNACSIADLLGYSEGWKRKEALEIGFKLEGITGYDLVPTFLVNDPQAVDPQRLNEHTGTHAAFVAMGSQGSNASAIAQVYGKDITPTNINDILVGAGLQVRIASGKYTPTEKGKVLCNQSTLASGKLKGTIIIKDWLYNSNKSLRDIISAGVEKIRKSRIICSIPLTKSVEAKKALDTNR